MNTLEQQLKEWKQILLNCFDGKYYFTYKPEYDVTFIKGLDWDSVKQNYHFKLSSINTVYYKGKIDISSFSDFVMVRIKMLKFLTQD